jgi:uncharacterized protein YkwD
MPKLARRAAIVLGLLVALVVSSWLPWRTPDVPPTLRTAAADRVEAPPTAAADPVGIVTGLLRPGAGATRPSTSAPARPRSTATRPRPVDSTADPVSAEVVRLVNVARRDAGCAAVHADARLARAALGHSRDMARRGYFSHDSPDGVSPWDRARSAGYTRPTGENIAMGYRDAAAVMEGWMNSPGHRANILNCDSRAVGVGLARNADGTPYWTQLFGAV